MASNTAEWRQGHSAIFTDLSVEIIGTDASSYFTWNSYFSKTINNNRPRIQVAYGDQHVSIPKKQTV